MCSAVARSTSNTNAALLRMPPANSHCASVWVTEYEQLLNKDLGEGLGEGVGAIIV